MQTLPTIIRDNTPAAAKFRGPVHAVSVGTKAAPRAVLACRAGVALAAGKVGNEARKAEKASLATQASNGGFHTFAGLLVATFPKAAAKVAQVAQNRTERYQDGLNDAPDEETKEYFGKCLAEAKRAADVHTRQGFTLLIQAVLNLKEGEPATAKKAAKPWKPTKAQSEVMAMVDEYVAIMAERARPATH